MPKGIHLKEGILISSLVVEVLVHGHSALLFLVLCPVTFLIPQIGSH